MKRRPLLWSRQDRKGSNRVKGQNNIDISKTRPCSNIVAQFSIYDLPYYYIECEFALGRFKV